MWIANVGVEVGRLVVLNLTRIVIWLTSRDISSVFIMLLRRPYLAAWSEGVGGRILVPHHENAGTVGPNQFSYLISIILIFKLKFSLLQNNNNSDHIMTIRSPCRDPPPPISKTTTILPHGPSEETECECTHANAKMIFVPTVIVKFKLDRDNVGIIRKNSISSLT